MKKCLNCQRRRLQCDGRIPACDKCKANGVECAGYGRNLKWVGGVACRGHLMNRKVPVLATCDTVTTIINTKKQTQPGEGSVYFNSTSSYASVDIVKADIMEMVPAKAHVSSLAVGASPFYMPLVDPILSSLDQTSRFFLDYFEKRFCPLIVLCDGRSNPYRRIIPLIGSSQAVTNAILALGACHYAYSTTDGAFTIPADSEKSSSMTVARRASAQVPLSSSSLTQSHLRFKQMSLQCLSRAMSNLNSQNQASTLATVILLIVLELIESGAGSWSVHLEGAKRLLELAPTDGNTDAHKIMEGVIDELAVFNIFGSTLVPPGTLTQSLYSGVALNAERDLPDFSIVGCPAEILRAISFCTAQRQNHGVQSLFPTDVVIPEVEGLRSVLFSIQAFDVLLWANYMVAVDPEPYSMTIEKLMNIASIWKFSAELYASRILSRLTQIDFPFSDMVDSIMDAYTAIAPVEELVKCIIWPVFVAGAESTQLNQRNWALSALDRVWDVVCSANAKNAQLVLTDLWAKHDTLQQSENYLPGSWDWIYELSLLDNHWLFF